MSSRSTILCSVIPLPLSSTGQLGQAHIQCSSVGICGAQCLFSPFWCSGGLFQKPSRESTHQGTDCSGHTVKGQHKSKWNHLHNCPAVIKPHSHIQNAFICKRCVFNLYSSLCVEFLPVCSLCFRAIYFAAYSKSKEKFNGLFVPNSGVVHMSSAGVAGEQSLLAFVTYM